MIAGIITCILSFLMGIWTHTNVYERHSVIKRVFAFIFFGAIGLMIGFAMTYHFDMYWAYGIIPVASGSILSRKIEEKARKACRMGDGPTADYFAALAEKDGPLISKQFQMNAVEILNDPHRKDKEPRVDDLIEAYNSARNAFGLEAIHGLDEKAPYI